MEMLFWYCAFTGGAALLVLFAGAFMLLANLLEKVLYPEE